MYVKSSIKSTAHCVILNIVIFIVNMQPLSRVMEVRLLVITQILIKVHGALIFFFCREYLCVCFSADLCTKLIIILCQNGFEGVVQ